MGDPLHAIEKFGIGSPWLLWRIARGGLDAYCESCRGRGFAARSPCTNRERGSIPQCSRETGCDDCRYPCPACRGARLRPPDELYAEDFGDAESLAVARRVLGAVEVEQSRPRVDRNPRAL